MKKFVPIFWFSLLLVFSLINMWTIEEKDLKRVSLGINKFSFDIYKVLKDRNKETNLFYSPASISIAFAMTVAGAKGNTQKEIAEVFNFTLPVEKFHTAYSKLITTLKNRKEYELNIANALWLQEDSKFIPEFLNTIGKHYKAGINKVNFKCNPYDACKKINNWVSKETKNRIKDILRPENITYDTVLILANAIYFKGNWEKKFDRKFTRDEDFYLIDGRKTKVKMMYMKGDLRYFENSDIQLLELPYTDNKISMLLILPKDSKKLENIEDLMDENRLEEWLNSLTHWEVSVYIPKFRFTQAYDLTEILESMGIKDAFNISKANFSGISETEKLFISKVFHKTFLEVSEESTEAAGVTIVMEKTAMLIEKRVTFKANHPFIFLIKDNFTGCILFMGRIMNPNN